MTTQDKLYNPSAARAILGFRPRHEAGAYGGGSTGYRWAFGDTGTSWTITGTPVASNNTLIGGLCTITSGTTEDDAAMAITPNREFPSPHENGGGSPGNGAMVCQIFVPGGNLKNLAIGARASSLAPTAGTEATSAWGVSRLAATDPDNFYAFMHGYTRRRLGAYTADHQYALITEVVGSRMRISLYDFTDDKWIGATSFPTDGIATGTGSRARGFYSATAASGGTAVTLALGITTVLPSFRAML